ncbi:Organelle RRM domain-containing protein 1, chloroplastic [Frankliniella fusca]|uniref:Organelle RRM domain-containing protein 1, chloroplastic n=1 Tax=Frankliniella fusca TaxID=407009 RepID=A0AAE1I3W8_9NEOP|nr:Organelle RRM domain-containing protein 1, chloroplastic [Frankliniella fusca]
MSLEGVPGVVTTPANIPTSTAEDRDGGAEDDDDDDDDAASPPAPGPGLASRMLQYAGQLWTEQGAGLGRSVSRQVGVVLGQPPPLAPPPALDALRRVARALKEKQD